MYINIIVCKTGKHKGQSGSKVTKPFSLVVSFRPAGGQIFLSVDGARLALVTCLYAKLK